MLARQSEDRRLTIEVPWVTTMVTLGVLRSSHVRTVRPSLTRAARE
jgi:hypothetical protein